MPAVVRHKVAIEVDAASRSEFLENPDADRCYSRNYAQLCEPAHHESSFQLVICQPR